jgi:hypothetical protein
VKVGEITDWIEGAQILSAEVDEGDEGMHIVLSNGLMLVVVGVVGLVRFGTKDLH